MRPLKTHDTHYFVVNAPFYFVYNDAKKAWQGLISEVGLSLKFVMYFFLRISETRKQLRIIFMPEKEFTVNYSQNRQTETITGALLYYCSILLTRLRLKIM